MSGNLAREANGVTSLAEDSTPHIEAIGEKLLALSAYGPVEVETQVPGIPGVTYEESGRRGERPVAIIGSTALSVGSDESGVRVMVQAKEDAEPITLLPEQIEDVSVEHPHGEGMPLHGTSMMALALTNRHGISVLRWPDHVIEYGWHNRIETSNHSEYPGIYVVKTYAADDQNTTGRGQAKIPTLEEAKALGTKPGVYYLSKVDDRSYVVTARMGLEKTRPVTIRRPRHPGNEPIMQIEMLDLHKNTTDEELLATHIERYRDLKGEYFANPAWPIEPYEGDGVFLYMASD